LRSVDLLGEQLPVPDGSHHLLRIRTGFFVHGSVLTPTGQVSLPLSIAISNPSAELSILLAKMRPKGINVSGPFNR
jgi:hypothetical protein